MDTRYRCEEVKMSKAAVNGDQGGKATPKSSIVAVTPGRDEISGLGFTTWLRRRVEI